MTSAMSSALVGGVFGAAVVEGLVEGVDGWRKLTFRFRDPTVRAMIQVMMTMVDA